MNLTTIVCYIAWKERKIIFSLAYNLLRQFIETSDVWDYRFQFDHKRHLFSGRKRRFEGGILDELGLFTDMKNGEPSAKIMKGSVGESSDDSDSDNESDSESSEEINIGNLSYILVSILFRIIN